jgi:phosphopantetheine adenylyltransferase
MYSYNIFPLGVLSIAQIEKGQEVLDDIANVINKKNNKNELLSLSNKFFTLIPHISEKLKVIKTHNVVKEKNELLEYMRKVSNEDI